jgi:cyclic lactone autoinducer peptide
MNDKEKNMERFFTKTTLKGISKVTEYVAKKTVNGACLLVHGQPKEPASLKRLKTNK